MVATAVFGKVSPGITKMIRMDHSHVMVTFHKYQIDAPLSKKRAIVKTVLLALEIHAQLEEEIFYPALADVDPGNEALKKARSEHGEMKRLISKLRSMAPENRSYDDTFMQLMREVVHHVADEETVMLPAAESLLRDRLGELGAQMTARRMQLAAPHAREIMVNSVRAMPVTAMVMAAALVTGGWLVARALSSSPHRARLSA